MTANRSTSSLSENYDSKLKNSMMPPLSSVLYKTEQNSCFTVPKLESKVIVPCIGVTSETPIGKFTNRLFTLQGHVPLA